MANTLVSILETASSMAKGMGVAGTHVAKAEDIQRAVAAAFKSGKPHLIEIEIDHGNSQMRGLLWENAPPR